MWVVDSVASFPHSRRLQSAQTPLGEETWVSAVVTNIYQIREDCDLVVINAEKYGEKPETLELKAGEISLHSDWTLHGSDINFSKRRRCGLAMRFLSKDVKAYNGWNAHSIICRGDDPSGHWANHPRPSGEVIPVKSDSFRDATMENLIETK